ncbi:hypothetical protein FJZ48_02255 [Candidatus Uhrbacteria bacterium]|nr:hypothetical protein [Candidatus Uhrbacteria bacterium]
MTPARREHFYLGGLFVFLFLLFTILPFAGTTIFASPDETSYAVVAKEMALNNRAFIPDALVGAFPWLHPRSWVSLGDRISPVGFLGWPWLLSFFYRIGGTVILAWVGSLLILSSAWPFFQLLRSRFGFVAAWWGTIVAFTLPSVILYANRSLFVNGAFLALTLWVLWLLKKLPVTQRYRFLISATLCSLLISLRPIELLWLAPWIWWFGHDLRPTKRDWYQMIAGCLLVIIPLAWFAHGAYGSWIGIGYGLRDSQPSIEYGVLGMEGSSPQGAMSSEAGHVSSRPDVQYQLPYGVHLKPLLWNVAVYLGWLMLPWSIVCVAAAVCVWQRRKQRARVRQRELNQVCILVGWTIAVLLFIYGSGMYVDRFGPRSATIGNSFLRYLLPLAPLCGLAVAFLWRRMVIPRGWERVGIACGIFLCAFGVYRGLIADDEGVLHTRRALAQYPVIRAEARRWFRSGDVILSERSDKIFVPEFRGVSPLPHKDQVGILARSRDVRVGLFARPLSQTQKDEWRRVGLDAQELMSFPREKLYQLVPLP